MAKKQPTSAEKEQEKKRQALEAHKKRMWDKFHIKVELDEETERKWQK